MMCQFFGFFRFVSVVVSTGLVAAAGFAQTQSIAAGHREFRPGAITQVQDIPPSRLRTQLDRLPAAARMRAAAWLKKVHFTDLDLQTMQADPEGGIYYVDTFALAPSAPTGTISEPATIQAAVPISPFPSGLIFHSKPGAENVIYLNFIGSTVTGTAWNNAANPTFQAVAFSTDTDFTTFSGAEQTAIKRIWERVAEDYAPFNVDVTTETPSSFGPRTAMALITRSTDATGTPNPSSTAGGIAYIDVFGETNYANYRPAWIYYDNLASTESYIAEAASHEIGHNLGLSHDGLTSGSAYYGGHGTGQTSWGPIMGTGYDRNVSQWSKGEYYLANNTQDDLAVIATKLAVFQDDHGNTIAAADSLSITSGTNIVSTTPETDPNNSNRANKGILESNSDVDVFSFTTGPGQINLLVNPLVMPSGTRGGNLDIIAELHDGNDNVIATSNPDTLTGAQIQMTVATGTYYLFVRNTGVGDPSGSTPTGYTSYGSIGQYFISGYVASPQAAAASVQLTATVNNPAWGGVMPSNSTYASGSTVQVLATPAAYYHFAGWEIGASGAEDPITIVLNNNTTLRAVFAETFTTNSPTPLWWLAANGYTNDFENAVTQVGANGMLLWQSYVAGLDPNNPADQLQLSLEQNVAGDVLKWTAVSNRVYTIYSSPDISTGFSPVPDAMNLPATIQSFTNPPNPAAGARFYRIEVVKP